MYGVAWYVVTRQWAQSITERRGMPIRDAADRMRAMIVNHLRVNIRRRLEHERSSAVKAVDPASTGTTAGPWKLWF
jgi:hypothetical protein